MRLVPVALIVLLHAAVASAAPLLTSRVTIAPAIAGGTGNVDVASSGTTSPQLATATGTGGAGAVGNGSAEAAWGVVSAGGDWLGSGNQNSFAEWDDMMTITAPGVAVNTFGTLTFSVQISGQLSAISGPQHLSAATWQVLADVGGLNAEIQRDGTLFSSIGYQGDAFGTYMGTTTFQFGVPTRLYGQVRGISQGSYGISPLISPNQPTASVRVGLCFGGISNVSRGGQTVTNYGVSTQSGADYSQACATPPVSVPEPTVTSLALLGLAGGLARRRARSVLAIRRG